MAGDEEDDPLRNPRVSEAGTLADRVVVMGTDPGHIREIVEVDLARPRERTDDVFAEHEERIRALIGD